MNIKFEYDPKRIELLDHVIREMDSSDDEGDRLRQGPHLQVRCRELSRKYEGAVSVLITYKRGDGKFLGLDEGAAWKRDDDPDKPVAITMPISIPDDAETANCTISVSAVKDPFYSWSGKVAVVLLLSILASWAVRSYDGLLW